MNDECERTRREAEVLRRAAEERYRLVTSEMRRSAPIPLGIACENCNFRIELMYGIGQQETLNEPCSDEACASGNKERLISREFPHPRSVLEDVVKIFSVDPRCCHQKFKPKYASIFVAAKSSISWVKPGCKPIQNVSRMILSVLTNSPTTRYFRSFIEGCRVKLPANNRRVPILYWSRY